MSLWSTTITDAFISFPRVEAPSRLVAIRCSLIAAVEDTDPGTACIRLTGVQQEFHVQRTRAEVLEDVQAALKPRGGAS